MYTILPAATAATALVRSTPAIPDFDSLVSACAAIGIAAEHVRSVGHGAAIRLTLEELDRLQSVPELEATVAELHTHNQTGTCGVEHMRDRVFDRVEQFGQAARRSNARDAQMRRDFHQLYLLRIADAVLAGGAMPADLNRRDRAFVYSMTGGSETAAERLGEPRTAAEQFATKLADEHPEWSAAYALRIATSIVRGTSFAAIELGQD